MPDASRQLSDDESADLVQQFVDLGYIDPPGGNRERDNAVTDGEAKWNLARVYLQTGRYTQALPLLEEVYEAFPLRFDVGLRLAECLCMMGLAEEGREVAANLAGAYPNRPWAWMIEGMAELALRNREAALERFRHVEKADPSMRTLHLWLGRAYLGMGRIPEARAAFERGLENDPANPALVQGLATCAFRDKEYPTAANLSLDALALEFALPQSHLRLARCLARMRQFEDAVRSVETCLKYAPNSAPAYRLLRVLLRNTSRADEIPRINAELARIDAAREANREQRSGIRRDIAARKQAKLDELRIEAEDLAAEIATEAAKPKPEYHAPPKPGSVKPGGSGKEFVVVSGLPRSGTSLMMQMLLAGGLEPLTDGDRAPDVDNPAGYFEWTPIKRLGRQPHLIEQAEGKAVKVVSMLLGQLPPVHRYKVIFMDRPVEEIAESQAKMLDRLGGRRPPRSADDMRDALRKHRDTVVKQLETTDHVDCLLVRYPDLVANPARFATRVADFLGDEMVREAEKMPEAVRPDLYRNRSGTASS